MALTRDAPPRIDCIMCWRQRMDTVDDDGWPNPARPPRPPAPPSHVRLWRPAPRTSPAQPGLRPAGCRGPTRLPILRRTSRAALALALANTLILANANATLPPATHPSLPRRTATASSLCPAPVPGTASRRLPTVSRRANRCLRARPIHLAAGPRVTARPRASAVAAHTRQLDPHVEPAPQHCAPFEPSDHAMHFTALPMRALPTPIQPPPPPPSPISPTLRPTQLMAWPCAPLALPAVPWARTGVP